MEKGTDIDQVFEYFENWRCFIGAGGKRGVEPPFEITPDDFLSFAEDDLQSRTGHRLINCLSNIKRALDCQVDSLLYAFGAYKKAQKQGWNFTRKIEWLKSLEVLTPPILRKINKRRNLLEHEYRKPKEEEVEDALDVVKLFIEYTDRLRVKLWQYADIGCQKDKQEDVLGVEFKYREGLFLIAICKGGRTLGARKVQLRTNDDRYEEFLKLYIELSQSW